MKIELLNEPTLEFGNDFVSDDPKLGLTIGGFFSLSNNTHKSEIPVGIIGTNQNIEDTLNYIKGFSDRIEASDDKVEIKEGISTIVDGEVIDEDAGLESDGLDDQDAEESMTLEGLLNSMTEPTDEEPEEVSGTKSKRLNPDFIGFSKDTVFNCLFQNDAANNISIRSADLKAILDDTSIKKFDKASRVAALYEAAYEKLITTSVSKPSLCLIIIPIDVFKKCHSVKMGGGQFFNFRRYLKARLIGLQNSIPVQIILEDTILQKKKSMQDLSMQAWNFCVANYYKNGCSPWTLSLKDKNTCFIGISFHKVVSTEGNYMRASIAQAFNYEGKGIIFVGKKFKWDDRENKTKAPHLEYEYAKSLIVDVITEYQKYNDLPPKRVVVHKTTDYWDSAIHKDYAEVEGLKDGIKQVLGDKATVDLVTIKTADLKLLRKDGKYPVMRGTMVTVDKATAVLYTTGYIPIYETYPGIHIPKPIEISIYEGETTLKNVAQEILALTKLNFNNCNYYDSLPITVRFAQKVGEIIQYMDDSSSPPNRYFYYM
jgi:hypothetical protein